MGRLTLLGVGRPPVSVAWAKVGSSTTTEMPMWQTSHSFNHTVGAGTSILIIGVSTYDPGYVSAITFNGDAMTKAVDSYTTYLENFRSQIWYLVNPDVGTYSVAMTFTEQITDLVAGASNYSGIATSTPVRDTGINGGSSTSASVSVDAAQSGDLIYGCLNANQSTATTANTEDWKEYHDADNYIGAGATKLATGASVTLNWTTANTDWFATCVAFKLA